MILEEIEIDDELRKRTPKWRLIFLDAYNDAIRAKNQENEGEQPDED